MEVNYGSIQAGIYACMSLRLLKIPRNAVFSRACGLLVKVSKCRNLSENGVVLGKNGVVNGVVKLRRRRQIS